MCRHTVCSFSLREGENPDEMCSRRDADKVSRRVADVLKDVASLEILQAPGLSFIVPDMFASQPRLTGKAIVYI